MTKLSKIFKNIKGEKSIILDVELYQEDGENYIYIANDGSSGCKYKLTNIHDIGKFIEYYVDNYIIDEEE